MIIRPSWTATAMLVHAALFVLLESLTTLALAANTSTADYDYNTTAVTNNIDPLQVANLSNGDRHQCKTDLYAGEISEISCNNAVLNGMVDLKNTTAGTWGDRSIGDFDYALPQRYISCKSLGRTTRDWSY